MACFHSIQTFIGIAFGIGYIFIRFQHPVVIDNWSFIIGTELVGLNRCEFFVVRVIHNDISAQNRCIQCGHYRFLVFRRAEVGRHICSIQTGRVDEERILHAHTLRFIIHHFHESLLGTGNILS
ncbi:hypothetical protein D3C76_1292730 [compost metagenome]